MRSHTNFSIVRTAVLLWQNKWLMLASILFFQIIAIYIGFFAAQPVYRSDAVLTLEVRGEQIVDIENVFSGVSTETSAINTEIVVLKSRSILEKLVEELDLLYDPEFNPFINTKPGVVDRILIRVGLMSEPETLTESDFPGNEIVLERTIESLRNAISVSNPHNTYVFQISIRSTGRQKAALIANTLAEVYIQNQIDVKFQATENAIMWLTSRVGDLESTVDQKQQAVKEMRSRMTLAEPEELQALDRQRRRLSTRLTSNQTIVSDLATQISKIKQVQQDGDRTEIRAILNAELNIPSGRVIDDTALSSMLVNLITRLENDREKAVSSSETLEQALIELQDKLDQETDKSTELRDLRNDLAGSTVLLETFQARLKEASVQRGLQQADSRLLSKAPLGRQVAPRRMVILAVYTVFGFLVGLGLLVARQLIAATGIKTPQELTEATGQPVLGTLPRMPLRNRKGLISFLNNNPTSHSVEAVRNIRTSLLLANVDHPPQVIMSTSALPGEGKTTLSIALAHNFTGLRKRVILIECDIRRRTSMLYFDIASEKGGFLKVLNGEADLSDVILRDSRVEFDILPSGQSDVNAVDLFSSLKFQELLNELRAHYDHIIVDTPPLLIVPDARVIGQYVDSIVMSAAWNRTHPQQIRDALTMLSSVGLESSGFVLSQFDEKAVQKYGYGYTDGYGSYGKGYYGK
jgi:capsular exopolysaccharide synthesis family protein